MPQENLVYFLSELEDAFNQISKLNLFFGLINREIENPQDQNSLARIALLIEHFQGSQEAYLGHMEEMFRKFHTLKQEAGQE